MFACSCNSSDMVFTTDFPLGRVSVKLFLICQSHVNNLIFIPSIQHLYGGLVFGRLLAKVSGGRVINKTWVVEQYLSPQVREIISNFICVCGPLDKWLVEYSILALDQQKQKLIVMNELGKIS